MGTSVLLEVSILWLILVVQFIMIWGLRRRLRETQRELSTARAALNAKRRRPDAS